MKALFSIMRISLAQFLLRLQVVRDSTRVISQVFRILAAFGSGRILLQRNAQAALTLPQWRAFALLQNQCEVGQFANEVSILNP